MNHIIGVLVGEVKTDSGFNADINYKNKYLLDNFTNTNEIANKETGDHYTYDLRYYKVLRMVQ